MSMPLGVPLALLCGGLFGALLWVLPAGKLLVLLAGAALGLTILRKPLLGLLLFAVVGTFLPYSTVSLGIRTTVSEALLMLVWVGIWFQTLLGGLSRAPESPGLPERLAVALAVYSLFPLVIGQVMVDAEGNGPINWIRWLFNLSALFLVGRLLAEQKAREQVVIALLLGTLFMLLLSIPTFLRERSATSMTPILAALGYGSLEVLGDSLMALAPRMGSPWMHPNATGGALALLLPLALCYGLTRRGWPRALGLAVTLLGSVGLLLTGSRGALLSLVLVLVWMAGRRVPYAGRLLLIGSFLGVLLTLAYPPLQERLLTMFLTSNESTSVRFDEYANFPAAMAAYPFGVGFKVDPPVPGSGLWGISNLWLNYIYKIGLPGMLLFIAVTWSWWRVVRPRSRVIPLTADNAIWLGTLGGLLAALLSGLFDHYFSFTMVLVALFWLFMGLNLHEARRLYGAEARGADVDEAGPNQDFPDKQWRRR